MFDSSYELKDAGLVAASAAGTVDGAAKVADIGPAPVEGKMVVDVSALEIASNDELYKIKLQGSSREDFAHNIEDLAIIELGAKEVLGGDQDSKTGRYVLPFSTLKGGYHWRYLRAYCAVSGTVATGINYKARIVHPGGVRTRTFATVTATTTTTTTTTTTV